jgi:aspartyl-tRNA(Asn)/glutamyl-tRNA(Gln) amidotransferase subunit A
MYKTIEDVRKAVLSGTSVLEITKYYLSKIKEQSNLNVFVEVFEQEVLQQASFVDNKIKSKSAGKLAGVVVAIKDNICYKSHKVSASSKILENFTSLYTSTALQKLLDQDAIVIGRVNCDEFAMGGSNETSYYGAVRNNFNDNYVSGGSSGGSAVSVSANMCTISLGSDTGGSIRQPAAWTNTYGMKPTYGRVSRYGLIAYASSFDQIGCFSNSLEDAFEITEVLSGKDKYDSTSSTKPWKQGEPIDKIKSIAVFKEHFDNDFIDHEVRDSLLDKLESFKRLGVKVKEYDFSFLDVLVPTYYILSTAEASSNLARYDGVHFGYRNKSSNGIEDSYKKSRTEGFGMEVKRRIMAGTFVLSHGYYDAYYTKAQKVRKLITRFTDEVLEENDLLFSPTTVGTAFELEAINDPISMYLQDIYTVHANLTGNPALNVPFAFHSNGLPFGMQFMGKKFGEENLLQQIKDLIH